MKVYSSDICITLSYIQICFFVFVKHIIVGHFVQNDLSQEFVIRGLYCICTISVRETKLE